MSKKKQKYNNNYSQSSSTTQYSKKSTNVKYKQKPQLILKSTTKYISLIPLDILYRQNISHLSNKEYQHALSTILMDLNALLYFTQDVFFQQLEKQQSLRNCLQSCLACLGKNTYYNLSSKRTFAINRQHINIPNQFYLYYQKLHQVLLKIYHRISHTSKQQYKQIVYDCWLMDIPKMIDLTMIYCVRTNYDLSENSYANLNIVKEIIHKAISSNLKQYAKDFDDFINILYQDKLPLIHRDMKYVINLEENAMQYAKINFADPQRSFLITSQKILFQIKDLFTIVTYIYLCFPEPYKQKLATDHQVLQDMIKIFIEFVDSTALWKTAKYKQKFQTNFQAIHEACCQNFYLNFKIIKEIIQKGDSLKNDFYSRALNSYCVHSMYFTSSKIQQQHQKLYQQMIKTIIYRLQHDKQMFFLIQAPTNLKFIKLSEDQKVAIKKSHIKINQLYEEIEEIIENQQVQRRIKEKIDNFFINAEKQQQNIRFSQQNKIVFNGQINQNKSMKKKKQIEPKQAEQQQIILETNPNDLSLDFSALNEELKQKSDDQNLDLSFQELNHSQGSYQSDQDLSFQDYQQPSKSEPVKNFAFKSPKIAQLSEPADPQLYSQLQQKENEMQQIFHRSKLYLYDDQYEQKQEYYKSHKPEFGHYMGRLLQNNYFKLKPFI